MKTSLAPCPRAETYNRGDCCGECFNDPAKVIEAVREILTAWNFGPMTDRAALERIHAFVGDNIQNGVEP
mgnify:CR=1 FL=1